MAGGNGLEFYLGAAGAQEGGEPRGVIRWHQRVGAAVAEEDPFACERAADGGLIEHDHWTEEDAAAEGLGPEQKERAGDVRAIGEADGDQPERIDFVVRRRRENKVGERLRAPSDLLRVEHALGEPGEEA